MCVQSLQGLNYIYKKKNYIRGEERGNSGGVGRERGGRGAFTIKKQQDEGGILACNLHEKRKL